MCVAIGLWQTSIMACCISAVESCVLWVKGWLRCCCASWVGMPRPGSRCRGSGCPRVLPLVDSEVLGKVCSEGRCFLGALWREFRRSSWRGGGHVATAARREPEAYDASFLVLGALGEAAIGVIRSSVGGSSFHSRRGCPLGWVRALRKWVNVPRSPYICVKRLLVSSTVPGIAEYVSPASTFWDT